MYLHVLPKRRRVGVGFVAAAHLAVVRLVRSVHVRMLLPIRTVGKSSVASIEFTFEGFLISMNTFNVKLHLLLISKRFPANFTFKWFFLDMNFGNVIFLMRSVSITL